jgi:hypothetical protein
MIQFMCYKPLSQRAASTTVRKEDSAMGKGGGQWAEGGFEKSHGYDPFNEKGGRTYLRLSLHFRLFSLPPAHSKPVGV